MNYASPGVCWTQMSRLTRYCSSIEATVQLEGDLVANPCVPQVVAATNFANICCTRAALVPWLERVNVTATDHYPVFSLVYIFFSLPFFIIFFYYFFFPGQIVFWMLGLAIKNQKLVIHHQFMDSRSFEKAVTDSRTANIQCRVDGFYHLAIGRNPKNDGGGIDDDDDDTDEEDYEEKEDGNITLMCRQVLLKEYFYKSTFYKSTLLCIFTTFFYRPCCSF